MRIASATAARGTNGSSDRSVNNQIENLEKRKQEIVDLKQSYRENAMKEGKSSKDIEAKMQEYDGMIQEIDAEIAQIKAEQQQKAADGNAENANSGGRLKRDEASLSREGKLISGNLISSMTSLQNSVKLSKTIQSSKRILKTEALSYQPSFAFAGNPMKAAALSGKANALDHKLGDLQKDMRKSADRINDSEDDKQKDGTKESVEKNVLNA